MRKNLGLGSEGRAKPVLLPHEVLGLLYKYKRSRFHKIMGTAEAAFDYWWEIIRINPVWFQEHPHRLEILAAPAKWLPAKVFGDDGRVGKTRSLMCVHFYSPIGTERRTERCKMPSIIRNAVDAIKGVTDRPLWAAKCWSWRCLAANKYPRTGHEPSVKLTGWRKRMAGKPILGDFHVAYVGLTGDWMWTADTLNLQQSYKAAPGGPLCHKCGATYFGGHMNFTNFAEGAPHWGVVRSNAAYMASGAAAVSPASGLPGFHIQSVEPELMHGGPLGFNLTAAGSVLKELGDEMAWAIAPDTGTWFERLGLQLTAASAAFKTWQAVKRRRCSQPRFTVRRLTLSLVNGMPTLKAKAYNSIVVCEWLADECKAAFERHPSNSYFRDRAAMMWGLSEFYRILRQSNRWMLEDDLASLKVARDTALCLFRKLSAMAADEGTQLYPCRPKMHVFDECHHIAQESGLNPAADWTFQDEDNMRIMILIAQSCHGSTLEPNSLEKWCVQFFNESDSEDSE